MGWMRQEDETARGFKNQTIPEICGRGRGRGLREEESTLAAMTLEQISGVRGLFAGLTAGSGRWGQAGRAGSAQECGVREPPPGRAGK